MTGNGVPATGRASRAVLTARVDDRQVAFPLDRVDEVLPAMETTRLAHAPQVVRGVVNLRGEPLPVLDLRTRLGLPPRDAQAGDHVLVCHVRGRRVGLWVDGAQDIGVLDPGSPRPLPEDSPARHVAGVALVQDGVLLVCDVDSFLSPDEAHRIDAALEEREPADA